MKMIVNDAAEKKKSAADFREEIENMLSEFKKDATKSADDMKKVLKLNGTFQKQMDGMNIRLDEFPVIRAESKMQQNQVEMISEKMLLQTEELHAFITKSQETCSDLERMSDESQRKMKELKTYVGNLQDTLLISSNQITVASSAGFSPKPMVLFDVLKTCQDNFR